MQNQMYDYKNKIVAVTGASGYLASALIDAMNGDPAGILRASSKELPLIQGTSVIKANIRSKVFWQEVVRKADIIFHLAGNVSVYAAAKDPEESLNSTVLPMVLLAAAAREAGRRPRVIFASTATVYGLANQLPVTETMRPAPVTNYDLHKLFAEKQLALASSQGIVDGASLRLANVYGPSGSVSSSADRGILNKVISRALRGEDLQLYGDGQYIRDYVYIDDVVQAFLAAGVADDLQGRPFNVSGGAGTTVGEAFCLAIERVKRVSGKSVKLQRTPWPAGADPIELRNFIGDNTSMFKATGWRPTIGLQEGIDRTIAWMTPKASD